jgi:hypothetical protein
VRRFLIRPHQARVARHVGGEDRGEAADGGHRSAGEKLGLTNSTPKQPGGPSVAIRCTVAALAILGASGQCIPLVLRSSAW